MVQQRFQNLAALPNEPGSSYSYTSSGREVEERNSQNGSGTTSSDRQDIHYRHRVIRPSASTLTVKEKKALRARVTILEQFLANKNTEIKEMRAEKRTSDLALLSYRQENQWLKDIRNDLVEENEALLDNEQEDMDEVASLRETITQLDECAGRREMSLRRTIVEARKEIRLLREEVAHVLELANAAATVTMDCARCESSTGQEY